MSSDPYDLNALLPRIPVEPDWGLPWRFAVGLVVLGLGMGTVMLLTVWLGGGR